MGIKADDRTIFGFYLVPEFTMLAFSSAIEALRLANQVIGYEAYGWRVISIDGDRVSASSGISIAADRSLVDERASLSNGRSLRMAIICSGHNVEQYCNRSIEAWLRECRQRGIAVGALCTGAHLLARAGLLRDRHCTIHWENSPAFAERFADSLLSSGIYEIDNGIYTCAGGAASFDMMLHLIGQEFGTQVTTDICQQALIDRVRDRTERQRLPFSLLQGVTNPTVKTAVNQMEENLAEPIPLAVLAAKIRLSRRQLERLFQFELRCTPARYYLKLRLERARLLLTQTTMSIVDVAVACGFVSASHFSKCYRAVEGCSPQESRKARRSVSTRNEVRPPLSAVFHASG